MSTTYSGGIVFLCVYLRLLERVLILRFLSFLWNFAVGKYFPFVDDKYFVTLFTYYLVVVIAEYRNVFYLSPAFSFFLFGCFDCVLSIEIRYQVMFKSLYYL